MDSKSLAPMLRPAFKNIFPVSPENQKLGICQWGCFPGSDKRIIILTGVLPIIPASFNPQDLEQPQEPAKRSSFPRTLVRKAPRTAICCPTGHRFRERKLFKHPIFISRSNDRRLGTCSSIIARTGSGTPSSLVRGVGEAGRGQGLAAFLTAYLSICSVSKDPSRPFGMR